MIYNYNTRPYVVINGRNSKTIKGLIISELPPITKPAQRAEIEQIDGRDGDIITPLGFNAYDKVIKIGLSFGYDIDDIITYFSGEGKIVFSNEPDKYYYFTALEQVDFERLLRFKTAEISLHVQPFKFSDNEGKVALFPSSNGGEVEIRNNGNYFARPYLLLNGRGVSTLSINSSEILEIDFGDFTEILIDPRTMNAYNKDKTILLNRRVNGDYDKIRLTPGKNILTFSGNVVQIELWEFSRWL